MLATEHAHMVHPSTGDDMMESRDKKTERLHMLISPSELDAIDTWRFENRIGTRAEAVRRLCQMGLVIDDVAAAIDSKTQELTKDSKRAIAFIRDWEKAVTKIEGTDLGDDARAGVVSTELALASGFEVLAGILEALALMAEFTTEHPFEEILEKVD
ncbi:hypothetical protein EON80_30250, partial [bacterium]